MKLIGAVTQGSGIINEDSFGVLGTDEDVTAAWVMDGVTGINRHNYLGSGTDAAWLVSQADRHLRILAALDITLQDIVSRLVWALMEDWRRTTASLDIPADYDPPAACLILAKRRGQTWEAARLGDSCLIAKSSGGGLVVHAASPNNSFDRWLTGAAAKRRDAGFFDIKALLAEFQPQLAAARALRNTSGGYSILEAHARATEFVEYLELGEPEELLLCTDGYYRAVDHYQQFSAEELIAASVHEGGIERVLQAIRAVERADADCRTYPRFKPADDATAVMLAIRR